MEVCAGAAVVALQQTEVAIGVLFRSVSLEIDGTGLLVVSILPGPSILLKRQPWKLHAIFQCLRVDRRIPRLVCGGIRTISAVDSINPVC